MVVLHVRQATKGRQVLAFYSLPEYEAWKEAAGPGWSIKYYKGLGTSTEAEAKDYFAAIDSHRKAFVWEGMRAGSSITVLHATMRPCLGGHATSPPAICHAV